MRKASWIQLILFSVLFPGTCFPSQLFDMSGSGVVTLTKDEANLVGISIGGGAPLCPHVYIVQVFDNTPASIDGTLESGDRIVAVNNNDVSERTKLEVARMIQNTGVRKIFWILKLAVFKNWLRHSDGYIG